MPQLGGRNLVPAIFDSPSSHPTLLLLPNQQFLEGARQATQSQSAYSACAAAAAAAVAAVLLPLPHGAAAAGVTTLLP
jgi:hypothetical protein